MRKWELNWFQSRKLLVFVLETCSSSFLQSQEPSVLLKPAGVMTVGVVFLTEVAVKAVFFADNLYHHDG